MRVLNNTSIDFVGQRRRGYLVSTVLLLVAIAGLIYPGLEAGIDFKAGTEFIVQTATSVSPEAARASLDRSLEGGAEVKAYGEPRTLNIRTSGQGDADSLSAAVLAGLRTADSDSNPRILSRQSVSPRIASDLRDKSVVLVLAGLLVILAYIFVRFDWRFAVAAVLCLLHDVVVVLGAFAILSHVTSLALTIDQTIIAALLTIVGYSINDTVIVFDRIREDLRLYKAESFDTITNRAINQTLTRTLITSGTTILSVVVLLFFGGETLRGFALAMLIGLVLGTYSSIYVAGMLVTEFRKRFPDGVRRTRLATA